MARPQNTWGSAKRPQKSLLIGRENVNKRGVDGEENVRKVPGEGVGRVTTAPVWLEHEGERSGRGRWETEQVIVEGRGGERVEAAVNTMPPVHKLEKGIPLGAPVGNKAPPVG